MPPKSPDKHRLCFVKGFDGGTIYGEDNITYGDDGTIQKFKFYDDKIVEV